MANEKHLEMLREGVAAWNSWRNENPDLRPDLSSVDLSEAILRGVDFFQADLREANLRGADLRDANLGLAAMFGADLSGARLMEARLNGCFLAHAHLVGTHLASARLVHAHLEHAHMEKADLQRARLSRADLHQASAIEADLTNASLMCADLCETTFRGAKLVNANLEGAQLVQTVLDSADLNGSSVYGVSVWDLKTDARTKQENLVITPAGKESIRVDKIKVAQLVYLLVDNKEIGDIFDTLTSKVVLILGRFKPEKRKGVLDALREALRKRGYVPIVFDFERPTDKDFSETVLTLAGMSCFVIADITNPKSSPLELQATVPDYMTAFVPILEEGEDPFAMFCDLKQKYNWVLDLLIYDCCANLVTALDKGLIAPALEKRREISLKKAQAMPTRHVREYL
jgi:uncharacterized protein YjbI with pentapeptide repeats